MYRSLVENLLTTRSNKKVTPSPQGPEVADSLACFFSGLKMLLIFVQSGFIEISENDVLRLNVVW
jgi:hypothetical protein